MYSDKMENKEIKEKDKVYKYEDLRRRKVQVQWGTGDSFQLLLICFIFANCALNINIFFNSLIKDLVNNDLEQIIDIYFKYIFHVHDLNRTI